jgi:hypothetical protein
MEGSVTECSTAAETNVTLLDLMAADLMIHPLTEILTNCR